MSTCVFPGFGAHVRGMGKDLFDGFKDLTAKADEILGYSLKELCLEDPGNRLEETQYGHPALYVVCLLDYLKQADRLKPEYFVGHSLGESCALFAAGVFNFETGLKIVKKRAEMMAEVKNGKMAIIMGLSENDIKHIIGENNLNIFIANVNTQNQVVVSGLDEDIINAQPFFEFGKSSYIILEGMGPFHSRYLDDTRDKFMEFVKDIPFSKLKTPVISNVTGKPYDNQNVKELFVNQTNQCVRWYDSIIHLLKCNQNVFVEISPVKVVSAFIRQIKNDVQNPKDLYVNYK